MQQKKEHTILCLPPNTNICPTLSNSSDIDAKADYQSILPQGHNDVIDSIGISMNRIKRIKLFQIFHSVRSSSAPFYEFKKGERILSRSRFFLCFLVRHQCKKDQRDGCRIKKRIECYD